MKVFDQKHIKNIVLLGSSKSGKTTLSETMLFEGGTLERRGTVEAKNTVSDYHEIEHTRENSVYATSMHVEWKDYKINVIDTPGLDDFLGEIVSSLKVADTAVVVINGQHGVEIGTELIWHQVEKLKKPTILAINQLDHDKSNFEASMESVQNRFGSAAILMQYPLNQGTGFNSIIDLLKMVMYKFPADGGKPEKLDIPDDQKERADQLHNELVEKAAENDEKLMELYFEKGSLDEDEMRQGLKIGMMNQEVLPVFCLSAKNNMGSGRMMGFIDNVAPAASEMHQVSEDGVEIKSDSAEKTSLFVFKTVIEPNLGKLSFFKVMSGEIAHGDHLVNSQTGESESLNQLFIMDGKNRNPVDKLTAGDIGATLKLKSTQTNHTLHQKGWDVSIAPIEFPAPRIRMAVVAQTKSDNEKLGEILKKLRDEDPTLSYEFSKELRQLILSAQGELHLSIAKWTIEKVYGLHIDFDIPRIPYRETIRKRADATFRHKKQSGGAGQFGEVYLRIEPLEEGQADPTDFSIRGKEEVDLEWGGKLLFFNCIVGGVIDQRYLPAILKGVMEKMEEGPLTGSYVRDVRVMVYDGKMHTVDSNDISFKIAGSKAFSIAFREADPQLLEPIYDMEILVPEELMGDVMTDLQTRRSVIMGMDSRGSYQVIKARTPLAELDRYSTSLRSITQGRASFTSQFAEYATVPGDIQKKLTEEYVAVEEE